MQETATFNNLIVLTRDPKFCRLNCSASVIDSDTGKLASLLPSEFINDKIPNCPHQFRTWNWQYLGRDAVRWDVGKTLSV